MPLMSGIVGREFLVQKVRLTRTQGTKSEGEGASRGMFIVSGRGGAEMPEAGEERTRRSANGRMETDRRTWIGSDWIS